MSSKTNKSKTSSSFHGDTAVTLKVSSPEQEPFLAQLLLLVWSFLMIIAWVLLVVAYSLPEWITGTEATNDPDNPFLEREVGLFKQCERLASSREDIGSGFSSSDCFDAGFSKSNIGTWYAAGVLFVVGMVFLSATIVVALIAAVRGRSFYTAMAKLSMSLTSLCFMIAALLYPLGFTYLDDECPSGDNQGHCGLTYVFSDNPTPWPLWPKLLGSLGVPIRVHPWTFLPSVVPMK
eukprot:gene11018-3088_t